MFKVGDIIVPSMNNMESVFEKPTPQYKICQIGMGRVLAEDIRTGEITDVGPMKSAEYYYILKKEESEEDGITFNNLCNSCSNIGCEFQSGVVRTKCVFYMPPHIEPDKCGNYIVMQSTIIEADKESEDKK